MISQEPADGMLSDTVDGQSCLVQTSPTTSRCPRLTWWRTGLRRPGRLGCPRITARGVSGGGRGDRLSPPAG